MNHPGGHQDAGRFERDGHLDKPAIVGARWWQQGLASAATVQADRRGALAAMIGVGVALTGIGAVLALVVAGSDDDDVGPAPGPQAKPLLELQRDFGWDFSARGEPLVFDGVTQTTWDESSVSRMAKDLAPGNPRHAPFYVPTLFQAPTAVPGKTAEVDGTATFVPLSKNLKPNKTSAMDVAFARGRGLAATLADHVDDVAVVVDLAGPESVGFAAGMAGVFDPVFLFDNWPHPKGAVRAHRTLSAALYYQPMFARRRAETASRPPVFVLDRDRLCSVNETTEFDNRWVARLPPAERLRALGFKKVLYVTPSSADRVERDDLVDDFVAYGKKGITVRMMGADAYGPAAGDALKLPGETSAPTHYAYAQVDGDAFFWTDYPWSPEPPKPPAGATPAEVVDAARAYKPAPRTTPYSSGASNPAPSAKPRPTSFATIPVMVAVGTGAVLGWRHHRNGSWNRVGSSGGWGGG
jgi:hypothetical protein